MNTSELQIGDWVYNHHHKKNIKITPYDFFTHGHLNGGQYIPQNAKPCFGRDLEPIPITLEILERNGFTYCERTGGCYLYTTISYGNWGAEVVLFDVNSEYRNNQLHIGSPDDSDTFLHLMECNYVHQLQHALRLCGIEKEIEI